MWFTEYGGNRIGRINPTTGAVTEYSTGMTAGAAPMGIALGPDNNMWFTEFGGNRIGRITAGAAPAPTPTTPAVPTLSQWGMLLLAGLLAGAAALELQRRTRQRASLLQR